MFPGCKETSVFCLRTRTHAGLLDPFLPVRLEKIIWSLCPWLWASSWSHWGYQCAAFPPTVVRFRFFPSCPRVQSAIVIHCLLFLENRIYVNTIIIFSCTSHVGEKEWPGVNHELLPKRARHLVPKRKNVQKEGDQSEALANSLF